MRAANEWTNHQTWNYAMWIKNDQIGDELIKQARKSKDSVTNLANTLEGLIEESKPDLKGVYMDLLENAIHSINYDEIAEYLLQ
ncbi:MAG: hypothetical protein ACK52E_16315 [Aphanizomenon sp.]|jgi:hypothetical protein